VATETVTLGTSPYNPLRLINSPSNRTAPPVPEVD
jgi:hypothetical protein